MATKKEEKPEPAKAPKKDGVACAGCGHHESMHFEGKHRQCNTSGCACLQLSK